MTESTDFQARLEIIEEVFADSGCPPRSYLPLLDKLSAMHELLAAFAPHALPGNIEIDNVMDMFERKYGFSQAALTLLKEMMQR